MKWKSEVSARGYWYVLRPRYHTSTCNSHVIDLDSIEAARSVVYGYAISISRMEIFYWTAPTRSNCVSW